MAEGFQRVESAALRRETEDITRQELDAILCRFFFFFLLKFEKKDGDEYERESLVVMQCSLDPHLKNCGKNYSFLRDREFANSRQQPETKARELRVKGLTESEKMSLML